jgi:hypothetical protein
MKVAFFTVNATRTLNYYDLPRKSKMREMCTKCGLTPKGSILNISRLRQNIHSPALNTGTCEQQRAGVDTTGCDCHVNASAKRQKTRYESTVQRSTRLSKQSLLALPNYVRRYPAILFPLLPWQNIFCFWRKNSESEMFFL